MKKYILEISLALGLCASLITGALALDTQRDISCKLIRLHIIANSDSEADQSLKLAVRDEVLKKVKKLTENCKNTEDAEKIVTVGYLSPSTSWADTGEKTVSKYMDYIFEKQDGQFCLVAVRESSMKVELPQTTEEAK